MELVGESERSDDTYGRGGEGFKKLSGQQKLDESRKESGIPIGYGDLKGLNGLCYSRASATVWQQTYSRCLKRKQVLDFAKCRGLQELGSDEEYRKQKRNL